MSPDRRVLLAVGETMAVVTPRMRESVVDATDFRVDAGGAESNVAGHVAHAGQPARWFSLLGDDPLGHRIHRILARRGIDVAAVRWDVGASTGLYVKEPGAGVSYYRRGSAASRLDPRDVEELPLDDVAIVHLSGITPALSESAERAVSALIERARAEGVLVSFDVNHRPALWAADTAAPVLRDLAQLSDLVFVGRDEAERLWGTVDPEDVRVVLDAPAVLVVKDGAHGAMRFDANEPIFVPALAVEVVEEVGAGDAFAGGVLASLLRGDAPIAQLEAGHRQAALALTTTSDFLEEDPHGR